MTSADDETVRADVGQTNLRDAQDRVRGALFGLPAVTTIGRFRVQSRLGSGGMGVVYAAHDPRLDRAVALKLVRLDRKSASAGASARLLREARALARLSHPNVVPIYEVMEHEGDLAIAMELVDGGDLATWAETPRNWREVVRVLLEAGRGLAAAHQADLIHRDFKPLNVLVGADGRVRVTDFGLARQAGEGETLCGAGKDGDEAQGQPTLTRSGALLGTPPYMAPECWAGQPSSALSDQFAYGVTAYEILFGRRPFLGDTVLAVSTAILEGIPRPPPARSRVPRRVVRAILRSIAVDPSERFATMDALLATLERALRSRGRSIGLLVSGGVVAGGAVWVHGNARVCTGGAELMDPVWSVGRAAVVRDAHANSTTPDARETWLRVEPVLDTYAESWISEHRAACIAARVEGSQTERDLDLRMACLAQGNRELAALLDQLASVDADSIEHAVTAVRSLRKPERCRDIDALRTSPIEPPPAPVADAVQRLERRLAPLSAMTSLGREAEAEAGLQTLVVDVERLGYAPLSGRAYRGLAVAQLATGSIDQSIASSTRAFEFALDARDDWLTVEQALALAQRYANERRDDAKAESWIEKAEATIRRQRMTGDAACRAAVRRGTFHRERRDPEAAKAAFDRVDELCVSQDIGAAQRVIVMLERAIYVFRMGDAGAGVAQSAAAVELAAQVFGKMHPLFGRALHVRGLTATKSGDFGGARQYLDQARALLVALRGERSLAVADIDAALGTLALLTDRLQDAEARLERAYATLAPMRDKRGLVDLLSNMMQLRLRQGDLARARAAGDELIVSIELEYGEAASELASVLITLSNVDAREERWESALHRVTRAERIIERDRGAAHPDMATALQLRGQFEAALGDPEQGLASIERSIEIMAETARPGPEIASARMARAETLRELGRIADARATAEQARQEYLDAGGDFSARVQRTDAWLARLTPRDAPPG